MNQKDLVEIFVDLADLENESLEITENLSYKECAFFDSLFILSLISVIDEQYQIVLTGQEISYSSTIASLANLIQMKQSQQ